MNLSIIIKAALPVFLFPFNLQAQTASVDASTAHQTIDGFGGENGGPWSWASSPVNWNTLTSEQADTLFSPTSGIGISIYRSDSVDGSSPTLPPDIASAQLAVARGAALELSLQSPPSSMKYSGNFGDGTAGASGSCLSVSNSTYAAYVVSLIQLIQTKGITVSWLDVQNEPNIAGSASTSGFGACAASGAALDALVKVLGPAMQSAGLSTKIILGSAFNYANSVNYFGPCTSDPSCSPYVSVVAGHGYGYPNTPALYSVSGVHFWEGETADQSTPFDPNMDSAIAMAKNMQAFLHTGEVSSYNWWELGYINTGNCANCSLIGNDGSGNLTYTKRFYAFGNYSKFIRPGWVEIAATDTPQSGVYVTAFRNQSSNAFAIVAVNSNSSSVSQPFNLSGLSAPSVTPYVTDPNNNLASQSPITVSNNSFTTTLTASSVTTFVGGGNPAPGTPTGLNATIVR